MAQRGCRWCGSPRVHRVGEKRGYAFASCPVCELLFCPGVTTDYVRSLYASGYRGLDDGAPEEGWANMEFLQPALERLPDRRLRILDFGAGTSKVPGLLRERGHRVVEVDVTTGPSPHPDRVQGDLLDLDLEPFDLVYAFQVFEHLPQPRPYFERLLALTRPEGLLLIHTDMETDERREQGFPEWWYAHPPDHCSLFRHRSFEVALAGRERAILHCEPKAVLIGLSGTPSY